MLFKCIEPSYFNKQCILKIVIYVWSVKHTRKGIVCVDFDVVSLIFIYTDLWVEGVFCAVYFAPIRVGGKLKRCMKKKLKFMTIWVTGKKEDDERFQFIMKTIFSNANILTGL